MSVLGPEPLNPAAKPAILGTYGDDSLYGGKLYIEWGPAPVLVLLVPLHFLLGYEPSNSAVMVPFAIFGLGFALAALRVCLRMVGDAPRWMCVLAGVTLACASVVPNLLRASLVYHQAIVAGYCFVMAGLWLAVSAISDGRASPTRLALMSLCFGLAAGSRPTLGLASLILIPVFVSLKSTRRHRGLLIALATPVGVCFLLLAAYNYARYGSVLENGVSYQVGAPLHQYLGELGYVPIGLWAYLVTPPRLSALFPFISLVGAQVSYPLRLPAHYLSNMPATGGLLSTAPVAVFVVALPWIWRRRPALLGSLGPLLLTAVGVGAGILIFLSYEIYSAEERYEADYTSLFVLSLIHI